MIQSILHNVLVCTLLLRPAFLKPHGALSPSTATLLLEGDGHRQCWGQKGWQDIHRALNKARPGFQPAFPIHMPRAPESHTPLLQQTKERFVHPVFSFGGWPMDELYLEQGRGTYKPPNKIIINQIALRQEPRPCNFTESSFSSFSAPNPL